MQTQARFLPLLLRPRYFTAQNLWRRRRENAQFWVRNVILGVLSLAVMYGIYRGASWVLLQLDTQHDYAYFHPSLILGLFLVFLSIVLLVANSASALGSFFLGQDVEYLLASPISFRQFFFGKFLDVLVSSSWMAAAFLLPLLIAFAHYFHASGLFFFQALVTLIPFFCIPAGLAILLATFIALVLPSNWRREALIALLVFVLFGIYAGTRLLVEGVDDGTPIDTRDFFRMLSLFSVANTDWSPATWVAKILGDALVPRDTQSNSYICLLYSVALALLSGNYFLLRMFYFRAYSRAALQSQAGKIQSQRSQLFFERALKGLPVQARAIAVKEVKTASRDAIQAIQLLFLGALAALYLYVLSFEGLFQRVLPLEHRNWWRIFLISCNMCIEAFIVTAIANRLVFPSISREGRAYWTLQTAPLTKYRLLVLKYFVWLGFVAILTSFVFGAAALLLTHSLMVVLFKVLLNLAMTISVIALAIGFGARFANFEWDHSAQLIMGFGNLVYMVVSVLLIAANLFGGGILLFIAFTHMSPELVVRPQLLFLVLLGFAVAFIGNMLIARWALYFGAKKL